MPYDISLWLNIVVENNTISPNLQTPILTSIISTFLLVRKLCPPLYALFLKDKVFAKPIGKRLILIAHIFTGVKLFYLTSGDTVWGLYFIFSSFLGLPALGNWKKVNGILSWVFSHVKVYSVEDPSGTCLLEYVLKTGMVSSPCLFFVCKAVDVCGLLFAK